MDAASPPITTKEVSTLGMDPQSFPWVLVTQNNDEYDNDEYEDDTNNHVPFLMRSDGEIIRTLPELECKSIVNGCAGWLILVDKNSAYSILNLVTSHYFKFPVIKIQPNPGFSILLFPPHQPQIKLIVFQRKAASFLSCGVDDMKWREQCALGDTSYAQNDDLINPVFCGGKLFCFTQRSRILVEIDVEDYSIRKLPIRLPRFFQLFPMIDKKYMLLESGDHLFVVCLAGRLAEQAAGGWYRLVPTALEVARLNFTSMEWEKIDTLEDRAFFIGDKYQFSHHSADPIIETSNAYCLYFSGKSFYSFNIKQKTILVSFPPSNIPTPNMVPDYCLNWVMPAVSFRGDKGRDESLTQPIKEEEVSGARGRFSQLPTDILREISKSLILHDYCNFRSLNRTCRQAVSNIQWTTTSWDGFKLDGPLSPWLVFAQDGSLTCIEPWHMERIKMRIDHVSQREMRICYSKGGWLLILYAKKSILLWNGFLKECISLPDMLVDCHSVIHGCFSTSPRSKDCSILMISSDGENFNLHTINLYESAWHEADGFGVEDFLITSANNPVFLDGSFYCLGLRGDLGVIRGLGFEVLQRPVCPCASFEQAFLLESDGKLFSVFVGPFGKWVRLFTLDGLDTDWNEVKNIENRVLYLSSFSSFSLTDPTNPKKNRIYVPRLSGKNLVYYSPASKRFHSEGTEDVLLGFYNTSEQSLGGWLEFKW